MKVVNNLQAIGRALMLPIAVLPLAALLLRLGQPDLLDIGFVSAAGSAIFDNIGLLFATGVAIGFARDGHGAAALAGVVCYLVTTKGAQELIAIEALHVAIGESHSDLLLESLREKAIAKLSVPIGILSGIIAGGLYNKFGKFQLPEFLAFFGGKRFVPILAGLAGIFMAAAFGTGYTALSDAMDSLSSGIADAGSSGLFVFGVLNRLLIITGLHHILNNIAWFSLGEFDGKTGDLVRFFAGDPAAGGFMTGFFPVMMFGLPAACLAMYHGIPQANRKAYAGMLGSIALTAILTGVTEPIEFSFIFVAPVLYAIHALLTGSAMYLTDLLGIKAGFGFSAGLIDYALNFRLITRPLLLLVVGMGYALLYYFLFRFAIQRFNLLTPGREPHVQAVTARAEAMSGDVGDAYIQALGGFANIKAVDSCATRLRLEVVSSQAIDRDALKRLGARGVICPSSDTVQVVLGPLVESVAESISQGLSFFNNSSQAGTAVVALQSDGPITGKAASVSSQAWQQALGGENNLVTLEQRGNRIRAEVKSTALVDQDALTGLGVKAAITVQGNILHLVVIAYT